MQAMLSTERQRKLQDMTWSSGVIVGRDLPRDTVLKRISLRLSGYVTYTFSSTPVAYETSTIDNIVSRIDVVINGQRTVKSVRPHLLHMEQLLATTIQGERKASAAAAAALQNNPTADAGFTYGTTTQTTTVAETVHVCFEMILCAFGRNGTYMNLKGATSAEIKLACGTTTGLDKTGNATFTASSLSFEVVTIEAQDLPATMAFSDWKQTTKDIVITAQTTDYVIDINRGNFLAGIKLLCVQDYAAALANAKTRQPTNFGIGDIKLIANGSMIVKATTFKSLQAENRMRWGVSSPYATNASRLDGFAYLNLLENNDIRSALDCRAPKMDNLQLLISTNASDSTWLNYNLGITVETGEVVTPR